MVCEKESWYINIQCNYEVVLKWVRKRRLLVTKVRLTHVTALFKADLDTKEETMETTTTTTTKRPEKFWGAWKLSGIRKINFTPWEESESASNGSIFQFSMRGQQLFSYLRISAVKVTVKALTLSNFLRIFTACGVFVFGFIFWLLLFVCFGFFFCHLPPFSLCLSLSLFLFLFFFGKVQPQITFLLDLSLSVLKWPIYTEVNRQTAQQCSGPSYSSAPTRVDFAGGGENGSIVALAVWKRTASFCGMPSSF